MCVRYSGLMRPDIHAPTPDTNAVLRLRHRNGEPVLWTMTSVLGVEAAAHGLEEIDAARADFFGVNPRTIRRIRRNEGGIGELFVARVISTLRWHEHGLARHGLSPTLDELFEVVDAAGGKTDTCLTSARAA